MIKTHEAHHLVLVDNLYVGHFIRMRVQLTPGHDTPTPILMHLFWYLSL